MYRIIALTFIVLTMGMFMFMACDELATEPGIYNVSLNLTLPSDEEDIDSLNGHTLTLYLYEDETSTSALYTGTATVSGTSVNIDITEVDEADYYMLMVLDWDGIPASTGVMEKGDVIWACMDVEVSSDLTISLDKSYLQRYHSVIVGVRGYDASNVGDIVACALMDDGDSFWYLTENIDYGAYQTLYNQTAVFALGPVYMSDDSADTDEDWMNDVLETGNYDLYFLVDEDGSVDDYEGDDGEEDHNPISEGDQYYKYDFDYNATLVTDQVTFLTATFQPVQFDDISLTVNYDIPDEEAVHHMGDTVFLELWNDISDEDPLQEAWQVLSGASGTISMDSIAEGTYTVAITIGDEDDYEDSLGQGDYDDFMAWGGLDIDFSSDVTINVGDSMWQYVGDDIAIGISNVPSQYEGEMLLVALFANNGNYYDFHDYENFLMGGYGYVYNNGCLIALHPQQDDSLYDFELAPGNYDVAAIIDTNGLWEYYNGLDLDTVDMFSPYEVGDPYQVFDMAYDTTDSNNDFYFFDASFTTQMLGISGTVTCPPWTDGFGDIYVLTFNSPPFPDTSTSDDGPLSWDILQVPGDYAIPVFHNFSGYVLGVWDANDNGLEGETENDGGPDLGDYIGFYGTSLDSLTQVQVLSSDVSGIDFSINVPYHDSLDGGN